MARRLIEYVPDTKTEIWHAYDEDSDTTYISEIQDVDYILDSAKTKRNWDVGGAMGLNEYSKQGIKNNFWHVASIPNSVMMKWRIEYGVDVFNKDHWPQVKRLLNNSDWAYLRTGTGTI